MLLYGLPSINRTFFLTLISLKMLGGPLFLVCSLLNRSFLLFFEFSLVIPSEAPMLFRFILENYHSYFPFSFLTSVDLFDFLVWGFETRNTYTVPSLLVDSIQNCNCYFSLSILTSQTFRYVRQSLSHAFRLLKTLCQHLFLRFNLEKHDSHCDFSFLTTVDLFYLLFWGF